MKNFTLKLEEIKKSVGIESNESVEDKKFSDEYGDDFDPVDVLSNLKQNELVALDKFFGKGNIDQITSTKKQDEWRSLIKKDPYKHIDSVFYFQAGSPLYILMEEEPELVDEIRKVLSAIVRMKNFSNKHKLDNIPVDSESFSYIAFVYDQGDGELTSAMCKYYSGDMYEYALKSINHGLSGKDLATKDDIVVIKKFDNSDKAEDWMNEQERKLSEVRRKYFSETGGNMNNFADENIKVTDKATAREYGEALARNTFGNQFDQKIFDGVFATALEECGDNWDAVANYLKNVYTKGNKNFSKDPDKFGCTHVRSYKEAESLVDKNSDISKHKRAKLTIVGPDQNSIDKCARYYHTGRLGFKYKLSEVVDTIDGRKMAFYNFSDDESKMKNFSERLAALEESVGITPSMTTTSDAVEASVKPETPDEGLEVTTTEKGISNPAPVEPMNLSEDNKPAETDVEVKNPEAPTTPSENKCPECGATLILDFSNLTPEEFTEISTEAKEYDKYPEQYDSESEKIQAFSQWLENSRYNDFCKEALYKAFCNRK